MGVFHRGIVTLRNTPEQVTLTREQRWVAHHVVLDRIELEAKAPGETGPPPIELFQVFEKLEAGEPRLTSSERRYLCRELCRYVDAVSTPQRDEPVARSLIDSLTE